MYYFDGPLQERVVRIDLKPPENTKERVEKFIYCTENHYEMICIAAEDQGMNVLDYLKSLGRLSTAAMYNDLETCGTGGEVDWKYEEVVKRAV